MIQERLIQMLQTIADGSFNGLKQKIESRRCESARDTTTGQSYHYILQSSIEQFMIAPTPCHGLCPSHLRISTFTLAAERLDHRTALRGAMPKNLSKLETELRKGEIANNLISFQ
jgi:hypothetical protein